MFLQLYRLLTFLGAPLIYCYLLYRKKIGKEDPQRFRERLGYAASSRPSGALIWVHAASVGESLAVLPLIQKISQKFPKCNILLTTGTVTSARMIASKLPDNAFHQFVPVDHSLAVTRFLKHWQPNLTLWVESEIWPNLITKTSYYCPLILVNGRISDRSLKKWQRSPSLSRYLFSRFTLALPQTKLDAKRLEVLGAKNVKYLGNIKFDAPPLAADPKKMGELVSQLNDRPCWVASSTHSGEECMIGEVHRQLREEIPDLLTIIVPRHPNRAKDIVNELSPLKLDIALRSKVGDITENTDIYLADTMGELGIFYRLVSIVFVGGSLVPHGGQNPLEPARLECAVMFGPHTDNFSEIVGELLENEAVIRVESKEHLKTTLSDLLHNTEKQEELCNAVMKVVESKSGVMDAYIEQIEPYLQKIIPKKHEKDS